MFIGKRVNLLSMVDFELIEERINKLVYWYYPEGNKSSKPGTIIVDRIEGDIKIAELADKDFERDIAADELNTLAEAINEMKRERGATDFVEFTSESEHSVYYGEQAVWGIRDKLHEGIVPKKGNRIWY